MEGLAILILCLLGLTALVVGIVAIGTGLGDNRIPPPTHKGKRGGRYTEDKTKDGRPYRRYF